MRPRDELAAILREMEPAVVVPDELIGNRIHAFVALHEAGAVTAGDLERHCIAALPRYMVPEQITLRPGLPKTSTGKIDRRGLIEEAAGITKFKTKKRLAEARLEEAKQNLARVNDIFEEVTRQMNSLKRQASKAERYARLRDEMRAKLRVVLASKFTQLDQESAQLDTQLDALAEEMQQRTAEVQAFEAEHGERTQRGYSIEAELRENRDRIA